MKKLLFMVAAILVFASAPKVLMAAPAVMAEQAASEEVEDYKIDWTTQSGYNNMWADPEALKANISVSIKDGLSVKNEIKTDFWKIQYSLGNNVPLSKGTVYSIEIEMKGSDAGHATVSMGNWGCFGTPQKVEFTNQYKTITLPYTSDYDGNGFIFMQSGDFVGTISVKSIKVVHSEKATTRYTFDLADIDFTNGAEAIGGWGGSLNAEIIKDGDVDVNHITFTPQQEPYNVQVNFANVYPRGAKIKLEMVARGSVAGSIKAGLQNPDNYYGCGDFEDIDLTTDYKTFTRTVTCSGDNARRLLLNVGKYNGQIYIKRVKIEALEVPQETVTISSSGYSTYAAYYPVDYRTQGLTAYTVTLNGDKTGIVMKEVEGVVPAGVAVLLKGTANTPYVLPKAEGGLNVTSHLKLSDGTATSTDASTSTDPATLYALSTVGDVTAFYPVIKGSKIPAKRCYLEVKSTSASNAAFYSLGTNFGETTGISSVENKVEKADAPVYNLAGQLVGKDYKGLVIKNGKKFVIK